MMVAHSSIITWLFNLVAKKGWIFLGLKNKKTTRLDTIGWIPLKMRMSCIIMESPKTTKEQIVQTNILIYAHLAC